MIRKSNGSMILGGVLIGRSNGKDEERYEQGRKERTKTESFRY